MRHEHEVNRTLNGSNPTSSSIPAAANLSSSAPSAPGPSMINDLDLAKWLGISRKTLQKWRSLGMGPPYVKFGTKVVYRVEDIEAYIQRCLHRHR